MKVYINFITIFLPILLLSQEITLSSRIHAEDKECKIDTGSKTFTIEKLAEGKVQAIKTVKLNECLNFVKLPKVPGKYTVYIASENYNDQSIDFEINKISKDTIDLGEIILYKSNTISLKGLAVTGIKKEFIKIEADKTTFTVADNDILSSGSIYESLTKIPGVLISPSGGINFNGKSISVYIDGVPSSLSGDDLLNFIQSLPADTVQKIELISNPGSSYDANKSGAIVNIITQGKGIKGFSGTVNYNQGINKYNKIRPSLVLNGRVAQNSIQLITGYSYWEKATNIITDRNFTYFNPVKTFSQDNLNETIGRYYYFRPNANIRLSDKFKLLLKYNYSTSNDDSRYNSSYFQNKSNLNLLLTNNADNEIKRSEHNIIANLSYDLDSLNRKMELTYYYSKYNREKSNQSIQNQINYNSFAQDLDLENAYIKYDFIYPFSKSFKFSTGTKLQQVKANSFGEYNFGKPTTSLDFDYTEKNLAVYAELNKSWEKLSLVAGLRFESNTQKSISKNKNLNIEKEYSGFYPNINLMYKITSNINFITSYSRKVSLPSYGSLDPNISSYHDKYNSSTGNPLLEAEFYNNYEAKITAFNYLHLSANYSQSPKINLLSYTVDKNSLVANETFETYKNATVLSLNMGFPVPFGIFSDGLDFFNRTMNTDKMSFAYLFAGYDNHNVKGFDYKTRKPIWYFGTQTQVVLPLDFKFSLYYFHYAPGTYQVYQVKKPIQKLDLSLSKKFFNESLKATVTMSDVFNTNKLNAHGDFSGFNLDFHQDRDTRILWFKLSYNFGKYKSLKRDNFNIETDDKKIEENRSLMPN